MNKQICKAIFKGAAFAAFAIIVAILPLNFVAGYSLYPHATVMVCILVSLGFQDNSQFSSLMLGVAFGVALATLHSAIQGHVYSTSAKVMGYCFISYPFGYLFRRLLS